MIFRHHQNNYLTNSFAVYVFMCETQTNWFDQQSNAFLLHTCSAFDHNIIVPKYPSTRKHTMMRTMMMMLRTTTILPLPMKYVKTLSILSRFLRTIKTQKGKIWAATHTQPSNQLSVTHSYIMALLFIIDIISSDSGINTILCSYIRFIYSIVWIKRIFWGRKRGIRHKKELRIQNTRTQCHAPFYSPILIQQILAASHQNHW